MAEEKKPSTHKYVGKRAQLKIKNGLIMEVRVLEHKFSYGKDRFRVSPVAGQGETWVENITLK